MIRIYTHIYVCIYVCIMRLFWWYPRDEGFFVGGNRKQTCIQLYKKKYIVTRMYLNVLFKMGFFIILINQNHDFLGCFNYYFLKCHRFLYNFKDKIFKMRTIMDNVQKRRRTRLNYYYFVLFCLEIQLKIGDSWGINMYLGNWGVSMYLSLFNAE